jgi:hypothetical protein
VTPTRTIIPTMVPAIVETAVLPFGGSVSGRRKRQAGDDSRHRADCELLHSILLGCHAKCHFAMILL